MTRETKESVSGSSTKAVIETNPRGIPKVQFVENVEEVIGKSSAPVEVTLSKFQETVAKYKFMEINFLNRKKGLELKIPEINKTLTVVEFLISKQDSDEPIETTFELSDTLWANAKIKSTKTVNLWLGANVMLEYSLQEAKELLEGKLATAQTSLKNVLEDLEFLREQVTTMEVNIARVFNWDVKRRRTLKTTNMA
ncbi:2581_t:CDS:2 [Funneliformis geosporum]|uniref:Prefoldin subunit 3 n=1 Tax=Funneliformis geosporum TaxID=1117311 RepID=A0A9W4SMX5_9GLOM|nr:2581_t:CDS:2 [Funneliformis geosporum]CAI2172849.1 4405_t:CDS:2 [Funneliformis geosporum]